ncbi:MAG: peptidoglycan-associated lipoprotein Pal [bacterium]
MQKIHILVTVFVGMLIMVLISACGGSKETVVNIPEQFPEPEPTMEEPAEVVEPPKPAESDVTKKVPIYLLTINFEFDRADLTPEAKAILAENARKLKENPALNIRIEGHCDERGTVEYNLALGERRAISTRNYLINYGIRPDRITIISYGKERPIDPRHTPQAWAKNRRAEFIKLNQ